MEGFEIPIGGDFSGLQTAFSAIIASIGKLGDQISANFAQSNAAIAAAGAQMAALNAGANAAAASQAKLGGAASGAASKFVAAASTAGALGNAVSGMHSAMQMASTASRALTGVNLAATLSGWINRAGGIRAAFAAIPAAMAAIANNPTFRKIALGAALAVTAIVAIRTAWHTAAAGARLLASAATATFNGMVAAARTAARGISSAFGSIASLPGKMMGSMGGALPLAGLIGGLGGLAGAIGGVVVSIDKAAKIETLETSFATLLGNSQKAAARIKELAVVANDTPMEMPEIANASRILETLTRGALSTGVGLRMVGDVAAGTNAPFEELAMHIGRLYDGLYNGRPVGEAMQRLQELGIITGGTRTQIENLQKEGKKGAGVWDVAAQALGRFGGSMERQSRTWDGKLSTLRDNVNQLMAEFGKPIIDGLKPFLDMAIAKIDTLKATAVSMGNAIRNAFDGALATWQTGNIEGVLRTGIVLAMIDGINEFSSGIKKTVAYLGGALGVIMDDVKNSWGVKEMLGVFQDVAKGIGSLITASILDAAARLGDVMRKNMQAYAEFVNPLFGGALMDKLLGPSKSSGLHQEANAARNASDNSFRRAGNRIEDFNIGDALKKSLDTFVRANTQGLAEAGKAGGGLLIDRKQAAQEFAESWKPVQEQINKNRAEITASNAALDAKLNKGTNTSPMAEAVAKSAGPAVMSLTRVGGGGFANTVMNNMFSEAKKQTALLKAVVKNTSGPWPVVPVTYE